MNDDSEDWECNFEVLDEGVHGNAWLIYRSINHELKNSLRTNKGHLKFNDYKNFGFSTEQVACNSIDELADFDQVIMSHGHENQMEKIVNLNWEASLQPMNPKHLFNHIGQTWTDTTKISSNKILQILFPKGRK